MKKADISRETRKALAQSLKKFMAQKPFDKITVRELLEDCDVSRPTFYYHYEDTHNKCGEGLSSTFVESPWIMELRIPRAPFFKNQTEANPFLWMCAFNSFAPGKYTGKPETECTGMEILEEILMSLPMDNETRQKCRNEVVAAIPVAMPYIDAQFLPRAVGDRPNVIPQGSTNLGLIGQFVEIQPVSSG